MTLSNHLLENYTLDDGDDNDDDDDDDDNELFLQNDWPAEGVKHYCRDYCQRF